MNLQALLKIHSKTEKKYIGKIIYSLFLMSILQIIFSMLILMPIMRGAIPHDASGNTISFILIALSGSSYLLFQFGFSIMLLRMVRNEYVTLGYIFYGFKKIKTVFSTVLILFFMFAVVFFLSKLFCNFVFADFIASATATANETLNSTEQENSLVITMKLYLLPLLTFLVASFFLILIPFAFLFNVRFDNSEKSVFSSLQKSLHLIFSDFNFLKLIGFAFLASWKRLLITGVILSILGFTTSIGSKLMAIILNFFYFINAYTALIEIQLSVPVMYNELTRKHDVGEILQIEV